MCPTRACSWRETAALGFNGSRDPACAKLWDLSSSGLFDVDAAKVLGMPRDLLRPHREMAEQGIPCLANLLMGVTACQSSHGWYSHALLTYSSVLNCPYSHGPSFPARQGLKRTSSRCATGHASTPPCPHMPTYGRTQSICM